VAYAVVPNAFGANDVLAPLSKEFTFGADIKLDTGVTSTAGTNDSGNNVVQRGLTGGDQYKIQVDMVGTPPNQVPKATCMTRSDGTIVSETPPAAITAGAWTRLRCTRTLVGADEQLTLTVSNPSGGTPVSYPDPTVAPVVLLNFQTAGMTTPIPFSVGAKVNNNGTGLVAASTDQFNGRIDNVYVSIT
jgi:hypothetical protein